MKKDVRDVTVHIDHKNGTVIKGICACPARNSGYYNHVMALLLELADYSLNQLKHVPGEVACTSRIRQWGVPGDKDVYKAPVMNTSIKKKPDSKGIQCTLYDPRLHTDNTLFLEKIKTFKSLLANENKRTTY